LWKGNILRQMSTGGRGGQKKQNGQKEDNYLSTIPNCVDYAFSGERRRAKTGNKEYRRESKIEREKD